MIKTNDRTRPSQSTQTRLKVRGDLGDNGLKPRDAHAREEGFQGLAPLSMQGVFSREEVRVLEIDALAEGVIVVGLALVFGHINLAVELRVMNRQLHRVDSDYRT